MAIETLMVVAPLIATELGQEYKSIPAHLTVSPQFEMNTNHWYGFSIAMRNLAASIPRPSITIHDTVLPDSEEITSVGRLNRSNFTFDSEKMKAVHTLVRQVVHKHSGTFRPLAAGSGWNPHISGIDDFSFAEVEADSQEILLPELTVIHRINMGRKVVKATYLWEEMVTV